MPTCTGDVLVYKVIVELTLNRLLKIVAGFDPRSLCSVLSNRSTAYIHYHQTVRRVVL